MCLIKSATDLENAIERFKIAKNDLIKNNPNLYLKLHKLIDELEIFMHSSCCHINYLYDAKTDSTIIKDK